MKKSLSKVLLLLFTAIMLSSCQPQERNGNMQSDNLNISRTKNIYAISVHYTAENEGAASYIEIAQRSNALFRLLQETADAFIMDAYNYQSIDDENNMLYTKNTLNRPVEIDSGGYTIRVSKNYFKFNPIESVSGETIESQMIIDDSTLNILVPEKHKTLEADIIAEYLELFYFEKVEVDNIHLKEMEQPLSEVKPKDLRVNIIYVKDGQGYFTYRTDLAYNTQNIITDPIVVLYTGNIHISFAHSFMTQFAYFYSEESTEETAYKSILPYIQQCGAESSFQNVESVEKAFSE